MQTTEAKQQVMTSKQTYSVCFYWRQWLKLVLAEVPSEIKTLFDEYSENELMTPSHLKRFLIELSSDCCDIPIINALKKGVWVIELDIWPNRSKDNIDVLHGRFSSQKITCMHIGNWIFITKVPANGILITGHSLAIYESSMTWESKIVVKVADFGVARVQT
ncbi:hypothetical protein JHK86_052228 [Glycine max]|nr:hypothetical protein JHK86_052228 [Glycine max]